MPTVDGLTFSRFMKGQEFMYRGIRATITDVYKKSMRIILEGDTNHREIGVDAATARGLSLCWKSSGALIFKYEDENKENVYSQYNLVVPLRALNGCFLVITVSLNEDVGWVFAFALRSGTTDFLTGADPERRYFDTVEEAKEVAIRTAHRFLRLEAL